MAIETLHAFDDELSRLDATATAALIRDGSVSAVEVVEAAIGRAERVGDRLGAIATEDFARARKAATAIDPAAPFAGVPTFVKDNVHLEGLPTRNGTRALDSAGPADHSEPFAALMLDMGMVVLGKSAMSEFGFLPSNEPHPDHGRPTPTPWNLAHTAGGSSSGSAAMVAAGVVPVAHAMDGGGSIRIPAACCGLVGMKATRRRLPPPHASAMLPVDLLGEGLVARSVRDVALFAREAETRWRPRRTPPLGQIDRPEDRSLRIGVVTEHPLGRRIDEPTARTLDETAALLEALGHRVEPVVLPDAQRFAEDFIHYYALFCWVMARAGRRAVDPTFDASRLTPYTHAMAGFFGSRVARTPGALARLARSDSRFAPHLDRFDAVLTPTVATVPLRLGALGPEVGLEDMLDRLEAWMCFPPLANATGRPSISLPIGHDDDTNLPVGMMLTAARGRDTTLLRLARQVEAAHPWRSLAVPPDVGG